MTALVHLNERQTIIDYVYNNHNTEDELGLLPQQLQQIYKELRNVNLNLTQIEASTDYVCSCPPMCDKEELLDVLQEMDRRYFKILFSVLLNGKHVMLGYEIVNVCVSQ